MAESGLRFEFDQKQLKTIERALGDMKSKAPDAMKNALNATGKDAKRDLAKKAKETYSVKIGGFTKAMKQVNATRANLETTIKITGKQLELKDFRVSPASVQPSVPGAPPVRAKVLKSSGMKALQKGNLKAFIVKFSSGHASVAQRQGSGRLPIKKLMSSSIPKMVGSQKRVYGIIKPEIYSNLQNNINKQVAKILKGGSR